MNTVLSFFGGWQIKLILVLAIISGVYIWHRSEVKIAVNTAVTEIENAYSKEKLKLLEKANDETIALRDRTDKIIKDKDVKIKTLDTRVANLTLSLQNRPERPASNGSDTGSTSHAKSPEGATGLQLYRTDGEFLAWFSGQTSKLQVELNTCYAGYDEVKKSLDDFRKNNK